MTLRLDAILPPASVHRTRLANGLTVLARRDRTAPVVAIVTWVKAGYFDEPDDVVGLAGTVLGDLFVFGDIRDALREGGRYVSGQQADELLLGLACVGIAITAGTYASLGAAAPAR